MSNIDQTKSLAERIKFLRVDDETRSTLRDFQPVLSANIDNILDEFYRYLGSVPQIAHFVSNPEIVRRARDLQRQHYPSAYRAGAALVHGGLLLHAEPAR